MKASDVAALVLYFQLWPLIEAFQPMVRDQRRSFLFNPSSQARRSGGCVSAPRKALALFSSNKQLLEQAAKLRKEAEALRESLPVKNNPLNDVPAASASKKITVLEDSTWKFTYRFSSNPRTREKNNDSNMDVKGNPLSYYSGKFTVLLKNDGYSELIEHEPSKSLTGEPNLDKDLDIVKAWGWDKEVSSEDELTYVLFSLDVQVPKSDPSFEPNRPVRYYLQARLEKDPSDSTLALKEGTITKKEDISQRTGGVWGLFSVAGILSEFRYVGDFAALPV